MPPIFGILNTNLFRPDPEMILRMKKALHYVKAREVKEYEVSGGYLATAVVVKNPLVQASEVIQSKGDWVVIADSSLYKRKELAEKLGNVRSGEEENTRLGDTELILEAWLKWKDECVQYLYGDFSFIVFNKQTGEVFSGRDALGVRPLFYCIVNQCFIFASELRYIVESLPVKPSINHDFLLDTFVTIKSDKDLTPFNDIYRLKPGHILKFSGRAVKIMQYWSMDLTKTICFSNENDYIQLFREKLISAVNSRCLGTNVLAAELSGGLDSSVICGIASKIPTKEKIHFTAFSNILPAGSTIKFSDEYEFIDAMRQFQQFDWMGIDKLNSTIPELLEFSIKIQGSFIQQNYSVLNQGLYQSAGEKDVAVLLSGFGGDELVSARTAIPWNELIRDRHWEIIADELLYKGISIKSLMKAVSLAIRYLISSMNASARKPKVLPVELVERRFSNLPVNDIFAAKNNLLQRLHAKYKIEKYERLPEMQYAWIMINHLPQRLEYCYTAAAQYGFEYRYPLLDIDLVTTCLSFPPWLKKHHDTNRYIFRQASKGFIPEVIRQRDDKIGVTIPPAYIGLINDSKLIIKLIRDCSKSDFLKEIFDFSGFPGWYEKLVRREEKEFQNIMPGAFYSYLMIMLYFKNLESGT